MTRSINRMTWIAIAALAVLVLAAGATSVWTSRIQAGAVARLNDSGDLVRNHMTADMMHDAIRGDVLTVLAARNNPGLDSADAARSLTKDIAALREALAVDRAYVAAPDVAQAATRITADADRYAAAAQAIVKAAQVDPARAGAQLPAFLKSFDTLEKSMSEVSDTIDRHADAVAAGASATASLANILIVGAAAITVLVVLLVGYAARRFVVAPLIALVGVVRRMSEGDLSVEVPAASRRDELGQLAGATLAFRDQLAGAERAKQEQTDLIVGSVGDALSRLADGDLMVRVNAELTGPFAKLKSDFNNAAQALQSTMRRVSDSTSGINNGAADIRQASDDLSQRTEQQAASLEQTAAAMEQITSGVRESAARAARANAAVEQARDEAQRSGEVMQAAVEAMGAIERTSGEISDIISVIDGIAFQTNLLALNAGVEAARAGDAGKGFAVVASEVRALAQRSADAAKDVKARITASADQVGNGVGLVGETGEALTRIIERITEINGLVREIAASAEQQSTSLVQVSTAVSEMDGVTQQNAAMVEQATAAARSLAEEADMLASQVARFRTGGGAVTPLATARAEPAPAPAATARLAPQRIVRQAGNAALAVEDDWSSF
ncbi:methyl-accepting chemotaxis protein [Sphingomonas adhaesiva]|uniref:Methyl-accepting chemotaxis protein n=2 Tax=Sphingomonas adhaesiva TaxID=28212 RepID=A0A2A4I8V3_9SPHN|nr:methyl-accepting chemotaxis protein [Sphingomonas adhaesiva]PCG14568.1 methyl-accepting chemotaxis protein [Sphingomonas adhaesiva]